MAEEFMFLGAEGLSQGSRGRVCGCRFTGFEE